MSTTKMKNWYLMEMIAANANEILESAGDSLSAENRERLETIRKISSTVYDYCETHSSKPSDALQNIYERTKNEDWTKFSEDHDLPFRLTAMQMTGPTEGNFLGFLVRAAKAKSCLEVGMFSGYGSLSMAEALPEDGTVTSLELQDAVAKYARENFDRSPHGKKITIKIGPALDSLKDLAAEGRKFDLAFVDADKPSYRNYMNIILDELLAPGGAIVVDNTLFSCGMLVDIPNPARQETAHKTDEFNKWVAEDPRMRKVMLPVRDGITLITRAQ